MEEKTRYANEIKYKSLRDDYKTPPEIYEKILQVFGYKTFDLDVACTEHNVPAKNYFTKEEDGLKQKWGGICFCNPPWRFTNKFIKKAVQEAKELNALTCFVISSDRFYTGFMQDYVVNNQNAVFLVMKQKQGYIIPGEEDKPPIPSVGTAIVFITPSVPVAEDIKKKINLDNIFNTTAFRGGGIYENLVHFDET